MPTRASWSTATANSRGARAASGTTRGASSRPAARRQQPVGECPRRPREVRASRVRSVRGGPGREAVDEVGRGGERDGQALAGERVDVAGGVADEQHPAGDPAAHPLAQRPGAADARGDRSHRQPCRRARGRRPAGRRSRRGVRDRIGDADQVVGRPASRRPRESAAQVTSTVSVHGASAKCRRSPTAGVTRRRRLGRPTPRADRGVQPVGGDEVAGAQCRRPTLVAGAVDAARAVAGHDRDPGRERRPSRNGVVQHGAPHAAARAVRGTRACATACALPVGDAGDRDARRVDAEVCERAQRAGHQPFAAGLVDARRRASRTTTTSRPARAAPSATGQPGRPAADDQDVMHTRRAGSASFSARIRTVSSAALSDGEHHRGDPRGVHQRQRERPRRRPRRSWGAEAAGTGRR